MGISNGLDGAVGALPPGVVMPYAGATEPAGWLLCAGQAVSRTTYGALFAAIGTTYGTGNGSTTFNLPDLRGRVVAGRDNMGGTAASRLTSTTITSGAETLGNVGGGQTHLLTGAESGTSAHGHTASSGQDSPDHTHNSQYPNLNVSVSAGSGYNATNTWEIQKTTTGASARHTHSITVNNATAANASSAHNNVQPTMIMNYIIKAVNY